MSYRGASSTILINPRPTHFPQTVEVPSIMYSSKAGNKKVPQGNNTWSANRTIEINAILLNPVSCSGKFTI